MAKLNEEYAAPRCHSFDTEPRFDAGYECELPIHTRTQFGMPPKRPRILGPPQPTTRQPKAKGPLYLVLLIAALVIATATTNLLRQSTAERAKTNQAISPPAPTPQLAPSMVAPAPRAALIKLPPPKAQLVRLPQWKVNTQRQLLMPYGLKVSVTSGVRFASREMLPTTGNEIGGAKGSERMDTQSWMYVVGIARKGITQWLQQS
jgi:hypothetical protein